MHVLSRREQEMDKARAYKQYMKGKNMSDSVFVVVCICLLLNMDFANSSSSRPPPGQGHTYISVFFVCIYHFITFCLSILLCGSFLLPTT